MKKKKKNLLDNIYKYDGKDNSYIIGVSLDKYENIYNELDPTPFRKRDIESELVDYVVDSSIDIPIKYDVKLNLYLPSIEKDDKKENNAKIAIHSYFKYLLIRNKMVLLNSLRRCFRSLVLGVLLFTFYFFVSDNLNITSEFLKVIIEGVSILGWVALWDVGEEFLFNWVSIFHKRRLLKRMANAKVEFIYK